ncbi:hypothetical protein C8J56DRAFT_1076381 [Mycena floridula]|nr:hypothetical protein C8J56DRAFT_1076381 [Mycena floridula]
MATVDYVSTSLTSLHKILSAVSATQSSPEQLQLHGELKSLETKIELLGRRQDSNILQNLDSQLGDIVMKLKAPRGRKGGSVFNRLRRRVPKKVSTKELAEQQRDISMKISQLKSSLLIPSTSSPMLAAEGTSNGQNERHKETSERGSGQVPRIGGTMHFDVQDNTFGVVGNYVVQW